MQDHRTARLARLALAFVGVSLLGFVLAWSFFAYHDPNLVASFASLLQACGIPVGR